MKLLSFIQDAASELKTVQWPNKDETIKLTTYVIVVSVLVGLIITGIDYLLNSGLSYIIETYGK
jgi:preprotein translocase SecE subunit